MTNDGFGPIAADCSVPPDCPDGWRIAPESEQVASRFREASISRSDFLDAISFGIQAEGVGVDGKALKGLLEGMAVAPANLLDHFLEYPESVPSAWKTGSVVFFWGTLYVDPDGLSCVRGFYWDKEFDRPIEDCHQVDDLWSGDDLAVVILDRRARRGAAN